MVIPTAKIRQNHRANLAPARMANPTAMGKMKAASPISGFGKPKSRACSVNMTDLQEMNGFRSQLRVASGLVATCNRSSVRVNAAIQPRVPARIKVQANRLLGLGSSAELVEESSLTLSVLHARLVTFRSSGVILGEVKSVHTWLNPKI